MFNTHRRRTGFVTFIHVDLHQEKMLLLFDRQAASSSFLAVLATRCDDGQNRERQYDTGDARNGERVIAIRWQGHGCRRCINYTFATQHVETTHFAT